MFEQNQNEREILFVRWAISACRFTSYIHPNILDGIFPLQDGDLVVKEVSIDTISRTMSREEACQLFLSKGYRAATFVELLHWWLLQNDCAIPALHNTPDVKHYSHPVLKSYSLANFTIGKN
jgi:hypothetical protein